jgi:hypothetical protein
MAGPALQALERLAKQLLQSERAVLDDSEDYHKMLRAQGAQRAIKRLLLNLADIEREVRSGK